MDYAKKRIFIGLITLSLIIILLGFLIAYYLIVSESGVFQKALLIVVGVVILLAVLIYGLGLLGLIYNLLKKNPLPLIENMLVRSSGFLLPVAIYVGRMFSIDKDIIKKSFIAVNNQLVRNKSIILHPSEVLLLLPHCLQRSDCSRKITLNIDNCARCGKCLIDSLFKLAEDYEVKINIVTGGTMARKVIEEMKPKAVVAVACERDLSSGIQDSMVPVLGILNIRPEGPCLNTRVDLEKVEEAINYFVNYKHAL